MELCEYRLLHEKLMHDWRTALPENRILDVAHADSGQRPEREIRGVLMHCGLAFEAAVCNLNTCNAR